MPMALTACVCACAHVRASHTQAVHITVQGDPVGSRREMVAWGVLVHHRAADPTLPPVVESSTGGSLASFIRHLSSLFTKIHQVGTCKR